MAEEMRADYCIAGAGIAGVLFSAMGGSRFPGSSVAARCRSPMYINPSRTSFTPFVGTSHPLSVCAHSDAIGRMADGGQWAVWFLSVHRCLLTLRGTSLLSRDRARTSRNPHTPRKELFALASVDSFGSRAFPSRHTCGICPSLCRKGTSLSRLPLECLIAAMRITEVCLGHRPQRV